MNTYNNITNCFDYGNIGNRQIDKVCSTFLFINSNLFIKLAYRINAFPYSYTLAPLTLCTLYKYICPTTPLTIKSCYTRKPYEKLENSIT